jgi:hypothetical protein
MSICSRARTSERSERGIVLVAALVLAVLYFALMELMMVDASRSLSEAQRFRARVVAQTLAENGVELAAKRMIDAPDLSPKSYSDDQGLIRGALERQADTYRLVGEGNAKGVVEQKMTVTLQGRIVGTNVTIDYADHSQ